MGLIPCPACGAEVSPAAVACPKCGHPFVSAGRKARSTQRTGWLDLSWKGKSGIFVILIVLAYFAGPMRKAELEDVGTSSTSATLTATNPARDACRAEYVHCVDDVAVWEDFRDSKGSMPSAACSSAARRAGNYGPPELSSWLVHFYSGPEKGSRASITSGKMLLTECDALLPNGFGGKQRVTVLCTYDLKAGRASIDFVFR